MKSFLVAAALLSSVVLMISMSLWTLARADVLEVRADGTGEYPNIREALIAAQPGDTVSLADGTYSGPDNMNLSFLGKPLLVRSQSNDPTLCVLDMEAPEHPREDVERRGFMFNSGEDAGSVVRGLTFRNGQTTGNYCLTMGAGVACFGGASPLIQNCIFHDNYAASGGAFASGSGASPTVVDCLFYDNEVPNEGGAVYAGTGSTHFLRCRFLTNRCTVRGGVITTYSEGLKFEDCLFQANVADCGGVIVTNAGNPLFLRCTFKANTASEGGILDGWDGVTSFRNCTFAENVARYGGVANCQGGDLRISSCTLYANEGLSAIMRMQGPTSRLFLDHSIIAGSPDGTPVFCTGANATITCCDFYDNRDGNWMYCAYDQYDGITNVSVDPLFCDPDNGNFHVSPASWCAPWNNMGCGLVGAREVGCTVDAPADLLSSQAPGVRIQPNPSRGICRLEWLPDETAGAAVAIFDAAGRLVRSFEEMPAGAGGLTWNGTDDSARRLPAGVYLVRVSIGDRCETARAVLD